MSHADTGNRSAAITARACRWQALVLVLLLGLSCLAQTHAQRLRSNEAYERIFESLVSELRQWQGRVTHETVKNSIDAFLEALDTGKIRVLMYELGGLQVSFFDVQGQEQIPTVGISYSLLDARSRNDGFAIARLVRATHYAWVLFNNPEGFSSIRSNHLEGFMYSMDATFTEALFALEAVTRWGMRRGPYVDYLLKDFESSNLAGWASVFELTDMDLVYEFYYRRRDIEDESMAKRMMRDWAIAARTALSSNPESEWESYQRFVTLRTWSVYMNNLLGESLRHIPDPDMTRVITYLNKLQSVVDQEVETMVEDQQRLQRKMIDTLYTLEVDRAL